MSYPTEEARSPTDESLWGARRFVQAGSDLRGYPALAAEDETEETLAAEPIKQAEKKVKPQLGEQAS